MAIVVRFNDTDDYNAFSYLHNLKNLIDCMSQTFLKKIVIGNLMLTNQIYTFKYKRKIQKRDECRRYFAIKIHRIMSQ